MPPVSQHAAALISARPSAPLQGRNRSYRGRSISMQPHDGEGPPAEAVAQAMQLAHALVAQGQPLQALRVRGDCLDCITRRVRVTQQRAEAGGPIPACRFQRRSWLFCPPACLAARPPACLPPPAYRWLQSCCVQWVSSARLGSQCHGEEQQSKGGWLSMEPRHTARSWPYSYHVLPICCNSPQPGLPYQSACQHVCNLSQQATFLPCSRCAQCAAGAGGRQC